MRTSSEDGRECPLSFLFPIFDLLNSAAFVNQCPVAPAHSYTYDSENIVLFIISRRFSTIAVGFTSSAQRAAWNLLVP